MLYCDYKDVGSTPIYHHLYLIRGYKIYRVNSLKKIQYYKSI